MRLCLMALVLALAPALFAERAVKSDAPDFNASNCINAPEATTLEQCKGGVVLIKFWGIN